MVCIIPAGAYMFLISGPAVYAMSGPGSILYYTDGSKINRVDNSSNNGVTVITTPSGRPYSIDCNSCDNKLYWANQADRTINRGTPSLNDNEVVSTT